MCESEDYDLPEVCIRCNKVSEIYSQDDLCHACSLKCYYFSHEKEGYCCENQKIPGKMVCVEHESAEKKRTIEQVES